MVRLTHTNPSRLIVEDGAPEGGGIKAAACRTFGLNSVMHADLAPDHPGSAARFSPGRTLGQDTRQRVVAILLCFTSRNGKNRSFSRIRSPRSITSWSMRRTSPRSRARSWLPVCRFRNSFQPPGHRPPRSAVPTSAAVRTAPAFASRRRRIGRSTSLPNWRKC